MADIGVAAKTTDIFTLHDRQSTVRITGREKKGERANEFERCT